MPTDTLRHTHDPKSHFIELDGQAQLGTQFRSQFLPIELTQGDLQAENVPALQRARRAVSPHAQIEQDIVRMKLRIVRAGRVVLKARKHQHGPLFDLAALAAAGDAGVLFRIPKSFLDRPPMAGFDDFPYGLRAGRPQHRNALGRAEGHIPATLPLGMLRVLHQLLPAIGR